MKDPQRTLLTYDGWGEVLRLGRSPDGLQNRDPSYAVAFLDLMRAYDLDSELPNIKKYLKLVRNKVKSEND